VRRGDGVVDKSGVVGVVLGIGRRTSDVLLLSDPSSSIDVVSQRTRARGVLHGEDSDERYGTQVEDFDKLRDVRPGDTLVTSGIGTRFPPGLLVGVVTEAEAPDDSLYLRAKVRPAVRFDTIEHVLVLVHRDPPRGPRLGREAEEEEPPPDLADAGPAPLKPAVPGKPGAKGPDGGPGPEGALVDAGPEPLDAGPTEAAPGPGPSAPSDAGPSGPPPADTDAGPPKPPPKAAPGDAGPAPKPPADAGPAKPAAKPAADAGPAKPPAAKPPADAGPAKPPAAKPPADAGPAKPPGAKPTADAGPAKPPGAKPTADAGPAKPPAKPAPKPQADAGPGAKPPAAKAADAGVKP
jgi:hypothetical protein